jgi:hypothetical protein
MHMIDVLAPLIDAGRSRSTRATAWPGKALLAARARRATRCGCRTSSTSTCATRWCRRSAPTASRRHRDLGRRRVDRRVPRRGGGVPLPRRVRGPRDERAPTTCAVLRRPASSPTTSGCRRRCTSCRRWAAATSRCCGALRPLLMSGEGKAEDIGESWADGQRPGHGRACPTASTRGARLAPRLADLAQDAAADARSGLRRGDPMTTTRSHKDVDDALDAERQREFMHALLADLRALERMLAEGTVRDRRPADRRRAGDVPDRQQWAPARGALAMLEKLGRSALHHRAGPVPARGQLRSAGVHRRRPLEDARRSSTTWSARRAARPELGMDVVLMGILPTMRKSDLGLDSMVPSPRYMRSTRIVTELRGGKLRVLDQGPRRAHHRARLGDARGVQLELPGPPAGRAPRSSRAYYNIAQLLAGPLMSVSRTRRSCSAAAVGRDPHRAVPPGGRHPRTRTTCARPRPGSASAPAGSRSRWSRSSRRTSPASARWWAPTSTRIRWPCSTAARLPQLKALRLHNGTIYRWNRACYGVTDGKPHLRIENRVMPAGPSTLDEVANARPVVRADGRDGPPREDDITGASTSIRPAPTSTPRPARAWARTSPGSTARTSRRATSCSIGCCRWPRPGCAGRASTPADIKRYLGVIDERARTARTGARWQFSSWNSLRDQGHAGRARQRAGGGHGAAPADRAPGVGVGAGPARRGQT